MLVTVFSYYFNGRLNITLITSWIKCTSIDVGLNMINSSCGRERESTRNVQPLESRVLCEHPRWQILHEMDKNKTQFEDIGKNYTATTLTLRSQNQRRQFSPFLCILNFFLLKYDFGVNSLTFCDVCDCDGSFFVFLFPVSEGFLLTDRLLYRRRHFGPCTWISRWTW